MKLLCSPNLGHKTNSGERNFCTYTVYDERSDMPIIVEGTAKECAKAMGIKLCTFYSNISKEEKGIVRRWKILKSYTDGKRDFNRKR